MPFKYNFSIVLVGILLMISAISLPAQDSTGIILDKIIANIGGELLLLSEVQEQVAILEERGQSLGANTDCAVLQNSFVQKLLLNQARLDSILVSDDELDAQLEARVEQILGMMNNDIEFFENYYGMTIKEVKDEFRIDLEEQLLIERMQSQIVNNVQLTPTEVKDFFGSIHPDSLPYFNSEVEYREVIMRPAPNESSKMAVKDLLEGLKKRVEEGEEFSELASIYSEDPGSAAKGGDLGWQKRGTFVPEFEAAVFNLQPMELSPIIETQFGYHLIQLIERRGDNINSRHILISPELTDEDVEGSIALLDSVRLEILKDSMSFELAVKKYSHEKEGSATNGGRVVNPSSGNTFFEIDQLEPDIYFTLDSLEIDEISMPFSDRNYKGDIVVRFIQLLSRTDPHQANLNVDYHRISLAAKEQKKSKALSDWMDEKVGSTFIRIDEEYERCPNLTPWFKEEGL